MKKIGYNLAYKNQTLMKFDRYIETRQITPIFLASMKLLNENI